MASTNGTTAPGHLEALGESIERHLREHRGRYILQGTGFIVGGILVGVLPSATTLHVEIVIGAILLLTGLFQLVLTLRSKIHWWAPLSGCASILVGILLLWKPLPVLFTLVTLLAILMTVEGLLELLLAFRLRPVLHWSWMLTSGVVTLVLAAILWLGFPILDVLYLGWVVATNLVLYGISLLMLVWRTAS